MNAKQWYQRREAITAGGLYFVFRLAIGRLANYFNFNISFKIMNFKFNVYLIYCIFRMIHSSFSSVYIKEDDDATRNVTELIKSKGYDCINYEVITPDGFILSLIRITKGTKSIASIENAEKATLAPKNDYIPLSLRDGMFLNNPVKDSFKNLKDFMNKAGKDLITELENQSENKKVQKDGDNFNNLHNAKNLSMNILRGGLIRGRNNFERQDFNIKNFKLNKLLYKDILRNKKQDNVIKLSHGNDNKFKLFQTGIKKKNTNELYNGVDMDQQIINSYDNMVYNHNLSTHKKTHKRDSDESLNEGKLLNVNESTGNNVTNVGMLSGEKPVVYLQHGLLDSASTWVINPANESLGFILVDEGFDVWLGNSRGNTYSRKHVKYFPEDPQFWDFSYDEMALYDLPAVIEFIVKTTSAIKINYIGHSQGGLIGLAGLSENKYLASKIKNFIGLAPAAYVDDVKGIGRYLLETILLPEILFDIFGIQEFLPNSKSLDWLADHFCDKSVAREICKNILFLASGFNSNEMNTSRIPVYVTHTPAGTSVKNMVHYNQVFKSTKFQKFDYGEEKNILRYNQTLPPRYNVSRIVTPVHIFAGGRDFLADPQDIKKLVAELKTLKTFKEYPAWAHLDFVWGCKPQKLIADILHILKN